MLHTCTEVNGKTIVAYRPLSDQFVVNTVNVSYADRLRSLFSKHFTITVIINAEDLTCQENQISA